MKLALRLLALIVLAALGVFAWRFGDSARSSSVEHGLVEPSGARASEAPAPAALAEPPPAEAAREAVPPSSVAERAAEPVEADGPCVHVRVISKERGEPVARQRLLLREARPQGMALKGIAGSHARLGEEPLTDVSGKAEFEVEAGVDYRLEPDSRSADGVDVPALAQRELREVELVIATEADRTLCGRIVDGETGRVLGDGLVAFDAEGSHDSEEMPDLHARTDGTFELHVRSWEQRFASAVAEGYARVVFALEPGHETPEHALDVRLSRAATLEVIVLDGARPAADAEVELATEAYRLQQDSSGMSFYYTEDPSWTATSDASGMATIGALPPRVPLKLTVEAAGHAPSLEGEPVVLQPGERRRIEIVVGSGATILGRLEDGAGRAVSGCTIVRIAAQAKMPKLIESYEAPIAATSTDEQGRFRFDDVPRGIWIVGPQRPSSAEATALIGLAQPVEVVENGFTLEVLLRVDRDLYVRGIVLDPAGRPADACSVSAYAMKAWCFLDAQTTADGHFSIGPMPAGAYSVRAGGMGSDYPQSESLQVEAGAADLELHLPLGGGLRGRIVDANGRPCANRCLIGNDENGWQSSVTEDGTFELRARSPGLYTISACTPDGFCGLLSGVVVRPGETTDGVVVVVQPGARLKLRYEGEELMANEQIRVGGVLFWTDGQERGTARIVAVPAGEAEVLWRAGEVKFSQHVALAPGEERELTWAGKP